MLQTWPKKWEGKISIIVLLAINLKNIILYPWPKMDSVPNVKRPHILWQGRKKGSGCVSVFSTCMKWIPCLVI